jgi:hypothetical protein
MTRTSRLNSSRTCREGSPWFEIYELRSLEEIIAEVTGLPNTGIQWTGKYTTLKEAVESFVDPGEELDKKGKGLNPSALSEPWKELAGVIQRYITCDGRYDVIRPRHLKLLAALKQRLVINLPFFLNAMLHEVAIRTQKAKDHVTIISHHGLVKMIVNRALSQTQITWGDLIEANRPLQLEQPELHHENPPQGIEIAQEGGDTTQMEVPLPQPEIEIAQEGGDTNQMEVPLPQPNLEIEADPQIQLAETSKKKRKRTIVAPKTSTEKKRRNKRIAQPGETQEMIQTEHPSQENTQENIQGNIPSLEHLTAQFLKGYEIEMAQVLGNLGISIDKDTNRSEEHQALASSSNPIVDLPDIEMPFPEETEQTEPHTEVNNPVEQAEHIEETEEQLLTDQGEEDPDVPQKQKTIGKGHSRIKKLKQENKLLRRRVKRIKVLKQKSWQTQRTN